MPTPRQHGGAMLAHVQLVVPAFKGLNTQAKGALLGPEWATKLDNTVIDVNGRVAARKGWLDLTSTAFGSAFISGTEYRKKDGTVHLVATTATAVAASTDDGDSWTDVTGTAAFTSGNWHLVNFNDFLLGFQDGEAPLIYNGTTSSQVADASAPTGGVGTAAFGRVWGVASDGVTLKYSALLDHTDWSGADAGSIDTSNVWPGNDTIQAVSAYNNLLVIFGSHNILVYGDDTGSSVGISPTAAVIVDTIPGVGCYSQASVQLVAGDLWFVSNSRELTSLQRVLLGQKSGSVVTLSKNVSDILRDSLDSGSFDSARLRSAFSPVDRFYLLSLPSESAAGAGDEAGKVFVFDTRGYLDDGSARCIGLWNQLVPTVLWVRDDGDVFMSINTSAGHVGKYTGYQDNSSSYTMTYESGWLDLTEQGYLIIPKRLDCTFYLDRAISVYAKWAFDFSSIFYRQLLSFTGGTSTSEWGSSEWGVAEWGTGVDLGSKKTAGRGTGQFIKVGVDATINGGQFSVQQIDLFTKIGRLKG